MKKNDVFLAGGIFLFCLLFVQAGAFQYASLPDDNLILSPWFQKDCERNDSGWSKNITSDGLFWGFDDKTEDPTDVNCKGEWFGFAARWARQLYSTPQFSPNQDAILWQVIGPVNKNHTRLHVKFLWVVHRLNKFRVRIYGAESSEGPWTTAWTVIDSAYTKSQLKFICPEGATNRDCWWDSVSCALFPNDKELTKTISAGYSYYKLEFLANYPEPDESVTGDVGMKVSRVYFKVSESGTTGSQRISNVLISRTDKPEKLITVDLLGRIIVSRTASAHMKRIVKTSAGISVTENGIVLRYSVK